MERSFYSLKAGNLANLKLSKANLKDPKDQELSIKIKSIGLNFADIFAIWGLYSATPKGEFIPGLEYSGEVVKVGSKVTKYKVGDAVMGVTRFGAYTTALNIDHRYVNPLPEGWNYEEGASYLVQVLTAYYALKYLGDIQEGHNVLIHSAAGGVGIWANRIAKYYKAKTYGTVGNEAKVDFCKKEGYDHVVVRKPSFKNDLDVIMKDQPLDLVMECIGGKVLMAGYEKLAAQGRLIIYGSARYASIGDRPNYPRMMYQYFTRPKIDPQQMIESNKGILGFNLIHLYNKSGLMDQLLSELATMNLGKPFVGHRYPFSDIKRAINKFQSGTTMGKVVINTD